MIRVAICDDHAIVRKGLTQILSEAGDISIVVEATHAGELRQRLRDATCDVLLIDIEMPGKNGIETVALLKKEWPRLPAIVLSIYPEDQYAVRALRAGASGYLNKTSAPDKLVEAVRLVAAGKKFISAEVSQALAEAVAGEAPELPHQELSDREFQVLKLIAAGKKLSEIANGLALSPKTVSVYRARILEKMHLAGNVELAHYAIKHNLLDPAQ
jgi:two-component system, NarL family, invasion response regulator UvrY